MNRSAKSCQAAPAALLTPEDLAERYAVTKSTILRWFHGGLIPARIAVGKTYRFDPQDVDRALAEGAKDAAGSKPLAGMVPVI